MPPDPPQPPPPGFIEHVGVLNQSTVYVILPGGATYTVDAEKIRQLALSDGLSLFPKPAS